MSTSKIIANMINQIPSEDIQTIYPHMNTQVHQTLNSCYNKKYSEEKHTININPFDTFQQDSINEKIYIPIDILINDFLPMLYNFKRLNDRPSEPDRLLSYSYQTLVWAISKHPQLTIKWIDLLSNQYYDLFRSLRLYNNENLEMEWIKRYPQILFSQDRKRLLVPYDHPKVTLEWFKLYGSKEWYINSYSDSHMVSYFSNSKTDILSNNPNVTLEWLEEYPDRDWNWSELSNHPNLTFEWLKCFPTKPWNWDLICTKKIYTTSNIEESLIDL